MLIVDQGKLVCDRGGWRHSRYFGDGKGTANSTNNQAKSHVDNRRGVILEGILVGRGRIPLHLGQARLSLMDLFAAGVRVLVGIAHWR